MSEIIRKILIIDDDSFILESIKKQLRSESYDLDFTNDPVNGLELAFKIKYDLVLTDIKMRPILGIEVIERIKKNKPELPVIVITGFIDESMMEKARSLGCSNYLIKPVTKSVLLKAIQDIFIR